MQIRRIEDHPCYDKDTGCLKGYVCPFCMKVYPIKEQAMRCKESHEDFEIDYIFEKGHKFPVQVIVKRIKGTEIKEVGTYIVKKIEVLEDGKVKKTLKEII